MRAWHNLLVDLVLVEGLTSPTIPPGYLPRNRIDKLPQNHTDVSHRTTHNVKVLTEVFNCVDVGGLPGQIYIFTYYVYSYACSNSLCQTQAELYPITSMTLTALYRHICKRHVEPYIKTSVWARLPSSKKISARCIAVVMKTCSIPPCSCRWWEWYQKHVRMSITIQKLHSCLN